ncbi:MAG: glutamate racemase [Bacteroidia bacterium]
MENQKSKKLTPGPIGVFDSGYGGLTILKELVNQLPQYDYIYLGDNARSPYGNRSFDTVTHYTQQCIQVLFNKGCNLIILACNTASAKALRSIQQNYLSITAPNKRVLGVIRPTTEIVGNYSKTGHIGILGTTGTINSESYPMEIAKFFPDVKVFQQACPMWVSLIENNEYNDEGANYFIKKYLDRLLNQSAKIDTIVLGCTHYPLLLKKIKAYLPSGIKILSQSNIIGNSLKDYLNRHPEIEQVCLKNSDRKFFTSDDPTSFDNMAGLFFETPVKSIHIETSN